jgi:flagellar biosynthesis GTPase FlhF
MISSIINALSEKVSVKVSVKGNVKLPWTIMRVSNHSTQATVDDILQQLDAHNFNVNHLRFKFGKQGLYCTYDSLPENVVDDNMYIMIYSLAFARTQRRMHQRQMHRRQHQQQHQQQHQHQHQHQQQHQHQHQHQQQHQHQHQHQHQMHQHQQQHQLRQHQQQHQHQHQLRQHQQQHQQQHQHQMRQQQIEIKIIINDEMRSIKINCHTNLKVVCCSIIKRVHKLHIYATEFKFTRDDPRGGKRPVYGDTWKLYYHVSPDISLDNDITIHCRLAEYVPIGSEHCPDCGALGGGGCKH